MMSPQEDRISRPALRRQVRTDSPAGTLTTSPLPASSTSKLSPALSVAPSSAVKRSVRSAPDGQDAQRSSTAASSGAGPQQ
jgi:hypothetical protein